ncbi:MAG: ankyrin repeat domain-containing protein, partial [Luteolibacter sp.]
VEPSARSLVQAAIDRDPQRVGWLLDVGVYTEQCDAKGRTPIRISIESSDLTSTFKLLDAKANVNATLPDQSSILGVAVERGESAIVEKLLAAGARTDGLMPDGEKILPWAIRQGRLVFVRAMMKAGADPHQKDRVGNPLLHVAMEAGRRDIVDSLIDLGADPGATNAAGETTIQLAFRHSWLDAVPQLAAAGADPDARCPDGSTLLEKAVDNGNWQHIGLLLKIGANPNYSSRSGTSGTPLERVFASGNTALLEGFLACGAKPANENWDPWLWRAFQNRDHEAARLLLRYGAKATHRGADGLLLVEKAAIAHCGSFVKLLLDYGNPVGFALPVSSARGDYQMVSLLLACGAEPNLTLIPTRDTPLSLAIRNKHDLVAATLIQAGADASLPLPEGQTAFHLAIASACQRTVKEMLDGGTNPNTPFISPVSPAFLKCVRPGTLRWALKYDRNVTPLMLAVDSGEIQTARYLIKAGAKTQVWTRPSNFWPMNFATDRNDIGMMRLLLGRDPLHEDRQIIISLSEQRARLLDSAGNEVFATKVSTGRKGYSTPTGEFVITDKYRDWKSTIYHASMPYFQRLNCAAFGMHQGVVPGYPASHGCIRVPTENAARLFTLTQTGDRVRIIP